MEKMKEVEEVEEVSDALKWGDDAMLRCRNAETVRCREAEIVSWVDVEMLVPSAVMTTLPGRRLRHVTSANVRGPLLAPPFPTTTISSDHLLIGDTHRRAACFARRRFSRERTL